MTSWTAARQASLSITNSWSPPKLMFMESVMPSNHLILCGPLLPPSIFPSIRVFSNESALHIRWPKYWSFSFSISPSSECSGQISLRMDWLDLLAVVMLLSVGHRSSLFLWFYDFDHLMRRTNPLEKTLMLGKIEGRRRRAQEGFLGGGPAVRDPLPTQGTRVQSLPWEDPTHCGMAKLTRGHS